MPGSLHVRTSPPTGSTDDKPSTYDKPAAAVEAEPVVPYYGTRKFRVGVQFADGSYVTDGTTAGATLTITQATAPQGLTVSSEVKTLAPCETDDSSPTIDNYGTDGLFGNVLRFTGTGLAPVTRPDSVSTSNGQPVTIDVLANDDSSDPHTELAATPDTAATCQRRSGRRGWSRDPEDRLHACTCSC